MRFGSVAVESGVSRANGRALRSRWEWSILILPAAVFVLLMLSQLWITDGLAGAIAPAATGPAEVGEFARGFLQISALTLAYILICLAAIQYFWREVRAAGADLSAERRRAVGAACAAIGGFGAALAVVHTFFPSFFAVSRITLEPTIGAYGATTDAIGISRLHGQLLALAPNLAGVAAAVAGSLHAALVTRRAVAEAGPAPVENGATPDGVPPSLLNGMVVVSGVLVASVLLVSLHVHAHGPLYGAGAPAAHAEFANFVSVVWGIGLSLVVALIYVPHLVRLGYAGRSALAGAAAADGANGPRGAPLFQKVEMALAIFGPVIIAVLARSLDRLLKAWGG
ncbi:MAG: hypothetical protein F4Y71_12240 [Acidobacteria bacterium]|nr:hypothetical protein [Acidobacteriota bacterium]